jgi:CheY-like chemotaxis protein
MQARMISDLLDVSRILSGKLHVANEIVDPALPLLRVLEHWTSVAQGRQIELDASALQPGQALVEADPARLEQVYANLLDNAIRFSPPGSRVEVGASVGKGSRWRLFVRDRGVGLASEAIQDIFQPFAQGDAQPANGKGLGLGLAIVKALVEAFGGRVWAESQGVGRGATFFVELPIDLDATAPSSFFQEHEEAPRLDGLRVLYVEDESQVASAMQDALGQLGATVSVANSYEQALAQLKARHVDVLVSDLNLGGRRGGTDVLLAMRAMARHAAVPAVAVSAYGTPDDRRQTQAAGFTEHLVKPVDSLAVAKAIRRVAR